MYFNLDVGVWLAGKKQENQLPTAIMVCTVYTYYHATDKNENNNSVFLSLE